MGNLHDHAKRELELAGWMDDDAFYGDLMPNAVLDIVKMFEDQGHSGMSAPIAIGILKQVLNFEPLTPLTGDDDEWTILDYDDRLYAQNKRCSHVFKRRDGSAYDGEGRIFRDKDGFCFTSRDSQVDITFPYVPTREYVDV